MFEGTVFSLFIGLASAPVVLIGQVFGRYRHDEAWQYHKYALLVFALCTTLWLTRFPIARQLISNDPQTALLFADASVIFAK